MKLRNPLSWLSSSWGYGQIPTSEYMEQSSTPCVNQRADKVPSRNESSEQDYAKRHILVFLLFLGSVNSCAMRVSLSAAIIAMVSKHSSRSEVSVQSDDTCPEPESQKMEEEISTEIGEFDWDEKTQGAILGSFFYGYLLTNYIGGRLAERFGGRLLFGLSVILTGILNILAPWAARQSTVTFMIVQALEGMADGVSSPAMSVMLSFWIPPQERGRALARIGAGCPAGIVIALSTSGYLTTSAWGWPSVFYLTGIFAIVWAYFWFKYVHDSPDQHPSITIEERLFIMQGVGDHRHDKSLDVPWSSMLTSVPFWALILTQTGNHWGFFCLMTELPTYLKNVQHFNMKESGIVSALPYMLWWFINISYSSLMDHLLEKKVLSTKQARRLSQAIANYIPTTSLLLVSWAGCNSRLVVALLCISVGAIGANPCGYHCGFQELAPNFAGTLTGISNTVATIPGFLAPAVTGAIINNQQTIGQWQKVFQLMAGIYFLAGTLYLFFFTPEVQPWNEGNPEKRKSTKGSGYIKAV